MVMLSLFILAMVACAPPEELSPIRIGAILPYTGPGSATIQYCETGLDFVFEEAGWEVAGREIILIKEDETPDPTVAVAKARKLVEEDKVDVILGPVLLHTGEAVGAYLEGQRIPHIWVASSPYETERSVDFMPYPVVVSQCPYLGHYAYDVLGYKAASLLYSDYAYPHAVMDGFKAGFSEKGGIVIQEQPVPMEELETPPYIVAIDKTADCVVTLLVGPASINFPRQAKEYGLNIPILIAHCSPYEEPVLAGIGDAGLGMIGLDVYTPLIDTPENKKFVEDYSSKYGLVPGFQSMTVYQAATLYLEAVKATGGDTSFEKISEAMKGLEFATPQGVTKISPKGRGIIDVYILEVVKIDDRYAWKPIHKIPEVGK
jgi:branched-chain amino acid transport system substrate-binding protein